MGAKEGRHLRKLTTIPEPGQTSIKISFPRKKLSIVMARLIMSWPISLGVKIYIVGFVLIHYALVEGM